MINHLSLCLLGISAFLLTLTVGHEAIVGGESVRNTDQTYQVSVQNKARHHICGGGIIHNIFVLTAANCIVDADNDFIGVSLYVLAKTLNLRHTSSPAATREVGKIHLPTEYNPVTRNNDIAILQLCEGLTHPTRPNSRRWLLIPGILHQNIERSHGIIAGFGRNQENGNASSSGLLKYATAYVLPNQDCLREYPDTTINTEKLFCARIESTASTYGVCAGDVGNLLIQSRGANAVALGVLVKPSPNCDEKEGRGRSALYTRVSYYGKFIDDVLASHKNSRLIRTITLL